MAARENDALLEELTDLFDNMLNVEPSERIRRIAFLNEQLRNCLGELDTLGLFEAGSHLDMSLHALEKQMTALVPDGGGLH